MFSLNASGKPRITKANFLLAINAGHTKSKKHPAHVAEIAPAETLMDIFNVGKTALKGLFAKDAELRSAYAKQTANYNTMLGIEKPSAARRATEVSFEDDFVDAVEAVETEPDEDDDEFLKVEAETEEDPAWA